MIRFVLLLVLARKPHNLPTLAATVATLLPPLLLVVVVTPCHMRHCFRPYLCGHAQRSLVKLVSPCRTHC